MKGEKEEKEKERKEKVVAIVRCCDINFMVMILRRFGILLIMSILSSYTDVDIQPAGEVLLIKYHFLHSLHLKGCLSISLPS